MKIYTEEERHQALEQAYKDTVKAFPKWKKKLDRIFAQLRKYKSEESSLKSEIKGVIDDQ